MRVRRAARAARDRFVGGPFSMRECAAVARHLELYGSEDEGVGDALANVLAHHAHAPQRAMVAAVFEVEARL